MHVNTARLVESFHPEGNSFKINHDTADNSIVDYVMFCVVSFEKKSLFYFVSTTFRGSVANYFPGTSRFNYRVRYFFYALLYKL